MRCQSSKGGGGGGGGFALMNFWKTINNIFDFVFST